MLLRRTLMIAAALCAGSVAKAQEHLVAVLAPSEQDAKDVLTSLVELSFYAKVLGYERVPRIAPPGELGGLSKAQAAQWVVVLSFCSKKDATARAAALADRQSVVVVAAKGQHADACIPKAGFGKRRETEKEYLRAIFREPTASRPRLSYAGFLQSETRFSEATRVLKKLLELDPHNSEAEGLLRMSQMMQRY